MYARRASSARAPRGLHLLRARRVAEELVAVAFVRPGDLVLDLGAGTGTIAGALVRAGARVRAVELDPGLAAGLRRRFAAEERVQVVEADALRVRLSREPFSVVANLPFGDGTAILRRLLEPRVPLRRAAVVVQWELAAKRAAVWPSTLLSAWWGAWHELTLVRRLPACAFAPPPAVDAAVLLAARREEPLVAPKDAAAFDAFLRLGYSGSSLRGLVPPRTLKTLALEYGFDPRGRPWDLDARCWAALFSASLGESSARPARVPPRHAPL